MILTAEELAAAREWIADCVWRDLDADDVAELTDEEVTRGVARHYDGGLAAFRETCVPA
jgi:hypothetical protein